MKDLLKLFKQQTPVENFDSIKTQRLADLELRRPSLEDVYLALTSDTEGSTR